jgi:hypothetical protein
MAIQKYFLKSKLKSAKLSDKLMARRLGNVVAFKLQLLNAAFEV